ncbi:MAG TPA: hypothetical protein VMV49_03415 [Candidatus Deferrimicrobium sp.]|nr:hypothetical protein [Candidatus Deferrimicrobium sp.]
MSYDKIKAILGHAKESDSLAELIKKLEDEPTFFYGKNKKTLIRRQRKQYIEKCVKLGFLNEEYQLTSLGKQAVDNFNEVLSERIFAMEIDGHNFKDLLIKSLANLDIPTVEKIKEKTDELQVDIPINQLRNYLNILAKCGVLKKNRKYTYTLEALSLKDFEESLKTEYQKMEKDPTGLIWYEQFKEIVMRKYNLSASQFDELFSELKKKKPQLISLQRSRTKSWLLLRGI